MRAALRNEATGVIEIDVGTEDAEVAATRFSRTYRGFRDRLVVRTTMTPGRAHDSPVPLYAVFQVAGPGRVRWLYAGAGGIDDGD